MAKMSLFFLGLSALLTAFGCKKSDVITDRSPFLERRLNIPDNRSEDVINSSIEFTKKNGLNVSVNRFGNRKISILIFNNNLNIQAINTTNPGKFDVSAISRSAPNSNERSMAAKYVDILELLELR